VALPYKFCICHLRLELTNDIIEIDSTKTTMAEIKLSGNSNISSDDKLSIPSTGSTSEPSQPSKKRKVHKTQD